MFTDICCGSCKNDYYDLYLQQSHNWTVFLKGEIIALVCWSVFRWSKYHRPPSVLKRSYLLVLATECYNASIAYTGMRICTTSGKLCQRWDTQSPHPHSFTDSNFPNNNITKSEAYCRDPGGVRGEPWCYTTDPSVEWETCDIPDCTGTITF